jgi:rRNA-processing protein FCF1
MEKCVVCDTGTLLSIFLIGTEIKGFLSEFKSKYKLIISSSTLKELKEFAKHNDLLGKIAKRILIEKIEVVSIKGSEITNIKKKIGVSGKRRITDADLESFILAKNKNLAFFTDDFYIIIHL